MRLTTNQKFCLRWMSIRDLSTVRAIESQQSNDWAHSDFAWTLNEKKAVGVVIEHTETQAVLGFMVYRLHTTSLRILRLAIWPKQEGQGLGSALLVELMRIVKSRIPQGQQQVTVSLGLSNQADTNWKTKRKCDWLVHSGAMERTVKEDYDGNDSFRLFLPPLPTVFPNWKTSDVQTLCGNEEVPPDLAVLADALQEAGCSDEWLLERFRKNNNMARALYNALRPALLSRFSDSTVSIVQPPKDFYGKDIEVQD